MRPLRLLLDGFGSYREQADIDFSDVDFFALIGPTGSGKSTVIDGLCFALYGTVPRWGRENVITHALAPSANACRVCLVFEAGAARYAAVRVLTRDRKGGVHTKEARLDRLDPDVPPGAALADLLEASVAQVAEGPDDVRAEVEQLLGLSYEHFTQCVLLPQGKFAEFLQAKPSDRQDLLVQLLAYGSYEQVGRRARERARSAASQLEVAQRQRDELAGATQDAELAAAARVTGLAELAVAVDTQLAMLASLQAGARDAAESAQAAREQTRLAAALRMPAAVPGLAARIADADSGMVAARQQRDVREQAEADARQARDRLGETEPLLRWRDAYAAQLTALAALAQRREALSELESAEQAAAAELEAATAAVEAGTDVVASARQAHAAVTLAGSLRAGQPCPVCLQQVVALPARDAPADLRAADAALTAAKARHQAAAAAARAAGRDAVAAAASAAAAERQLTDIAAVLDGAPPRGDVVAALTAIAAADAAAAATVTAARRARAAAAAAESARAGLTEAEHQASQQLTAARDRLVSLGAPHLPSDLADAWQALLSWAAAQRSDREAAQPGLDQAEAAARGQLARQHAVILELLADHGIDEVTDPGRAPVAIASRSAHAQDGLKAIKADRRKAATLDRQIAGYRDEIAVATMLGDLLKATAFERWLCGEALDSLVAEASATLMELSGGQYELDRTDRNDLVVIDYNDAGTRRPVQTLSGGETFQASLALALALSRQVAALSAGIRDLNSMFLDEGFGTLDEVTLDIVATTLERLAADSDRMVGVVTHVSALAERVPVQFTVSRAGGTSRIRKVHV